MSGYINESVSLNATELKITTNKGAKNIMIDLLGCFYESIWKMFQDILNTERII